MATWLLSAAQEKVIYASLVAVSEIKPDAANAEQVKLVEDAKKLAPKFKED